MKKNCDPITTAFPTYNCEQKQQNKQNSGGNRDQYSYNRIQYWKKMQKNNRCLLKYTHYSYNN